MTKPSTMDSAERRKYAVLLPEKNKFFDWLVIILLLAGPLSSLYFGGSRITSAYPFLLVSHVGLFLFCLKPFINSTYRRLVLPPGSILAFFLLVYSIVHWLVLSEVPRESKYEVYKLVSYFGAFLAWAELSISRTRWTHLLAVLLFALTILGWIGLVHHLQYLRAPDASYLVLGVERAAQYNDRVSGSFLCPNHFAHICAMVLIVASGLLLTKESGSILKLLSLYAIPLMGFGLIFSQSRSGLAGFLAGFAVTTLLIGLKQSVWKFMFAIVILIFIGAGVGAGIWYGHEGFKNRVMETLEDDVRWRIWPDTISMIEAEPIFGTGPGTYRHTFAPFREAYKDAGLTLRFAHNEYLHMFAEYGIIGLVLISCLLLWVMVRLLQALWKAERPRDIGLSAILLGLLVGSLIHSIFDFQFQLFANPHVFIMIFGVIFGRLYVSQLFAPFRVKRWFLFPLAALCMAGLVLTGIWATQDFHTSLTLKNLELYEEQYERVRNEVFVKGGDDIDRVLVAFAGFFNREAGIRTKERPMDEIPRITKDKLLDAGDKVAQFNLVAQRFNSLPPLSEGDAKKRAPIPAGVESHKEQVVKFAKAYNSLVRAKQITPDGRRVDPDPREQALKEVRFINGNDWRAPLKHGFLNLELAIGNRLFPEREKELNEEAAKLFRQSLEQNHLEDEAMYGLAKAEHRLGNVDAALAHAKKALNLEAFNIDYLVQNGRLLRDAGRKEEAKKVFKQALQLNNERQTAKNRIEVGVLIEANLRSLDPSFSPPKPTSPPQTRPSQPRPSAARPPAARSPGATPGTRTPARPDPRLKPRSSVPPPSTSTGVRRSSTPPPSRNVPRSVGTTGAPAFPGTPAGQSPVPNLDELLRRRLPQEALDRPVDAGASRPR